jgi:excisionase family DNA binding protein
VLTAKEVAVILSLKIRTMNRLFKKRAISGAFQVGKQWRLVRRDLVAHIDRRRCVADPNQKTHELT